MTMQNCHRCHAVFCPRADERLCRACEQHLATSCEEVVHYLDHFRPASLLEVCDATRLPRGDVLELIYSGRLRVREDESLPFAYPCQRCEAPIQRGRHCAPCLERLIGFLMRRDDTPIATRMPEIARERFRSQYSGRRHLALR